MDLGLTRNAPDEDEGPAYQPRRGARVRLTEVTQMRSTNRPPIEVTISDISMSGFRADCAQPILIGSFVSLDLPGVGPVQAQVRWQVGGRMGARFLDPVNLRRCDWLVARI